jgi:N-acetylmuramoyl-L-alanine amidase
MFKKLLIACGSLLVLTATLAATPEALIERIEVKKDRGYDYLDIYLNGWSEGRGLLLENTLYIDFPGAKLSPQLKIERWKPKRITSVRASQKDPATARLTIKLNQKIDYEVVNVFGRDKTVVEIGDRLDQMEQYQLAWERRDLKGKDKPLKPVKLAATAPPTDSPLRGKTIILDPGHGGDDPGAYSPGRTPEKYLTLQTARRAAEKLRAAGATVILTRNADEKANLRSVVAYANKAGADILISIHYNATSSGKICGTETYYYEPRSKKLAEELHEALVRELKRKDRGLQRFPFYVIKNSELPSVLLEPAYLTNDEEYQLANSAEFQEKLAEALVKGVKNYFGSR